MRSLSNETKRNTAFTFIWIWIHIKNRNEMYLYFTFLDYLVFGPLKFCELNVCSYSLYLYGLQTWVKMDRFQRVGWCYICTIYFISLFFTYYYFYRYIILWRSRKTRGGPINGHVGVFKDVDEMCLVSFSFLQHFSLFSLQYTIEFRKETERCTICIVAESLERGFRSCSHHSQLPSAPHHLWDRLVFVQCPVTRVTI